MPLEGDDLARALADIESGKYAPPKVEITEVHPPGMVREEEQDGPDLAVDEGDVT